MSTITTLSSKKQHTSAYRVLRILSPLIGVFCGLIVGAILIAIAGANPIETYKIMFEGAFGGKSQLIETILKTCPYLLIGLGLAVSFRARVWNIGAEGQYYMGALCGGIVALYCYDSMPKPLLITCMLLASIIGGALWGLIPAIFRIKNGMNEIISTLMLNYIAILFMQYMTRGPIQDPSGYLPRSARFDAVTRLPQFFGTRIHLGILIAILLVPIIYFLIWNTPLGFRLRAVGSSASVAKYAGFDVNKAIIFSLVFSGALAGMAGIIEVTTNYQRLQEQISISYGFNGVLVALLGRMNPFGVLIASFFFAALSIGAEAIHIVIGLPVALADVIQALIVLFVMIVDAIIHRRFA